MHHLVTTVSITQIHSPYRSTSDALTQIAHHSRHTLAEMAMDGWLLEASTSLVLTINFFLINLWFYRDPHSALTRWVDSRVAANDLAK